MHELEDAQYQWVRKYLKDVSRTFALSLSHLPRPMESYLSTSYLLCRIPDTVEDTASISARSKSGLLQKYEQAIRPGTPITEFVDAASEYAGRSSEWKLVSELGTLYDDIFCSYGSSIQMCASPWIREMTRGMEKFIVNTPSHGVRIQTMEDLERYCYFVAGTVGHLITDAVIQTSDTPVPQDELHEHAHDFGLFLQKVNIAKDVFSDYKNENSIFLPIEKLKDKGLEHEEEILEEENRGSVGETITDVLDSAENHIPAVEEYLHHIEQSNPEYMAGLAIPYILGTATIRKTRRNARKVPTQEAVKIGREEVFSVVNEIEDGSISIERLREKTLQEKFAQL